MAKTRGTGLLMVWNGQPQYLTLYEFERPDVSESEPWARVRAFMRHDVGSPGVYRRLYPK
ncbi:MAG TPA: hypothetical protein VME41_18015 [Stellaceae bacterium]|nr:hypothetical protein [Stellaceae bacterium]